MKKRKNKSYIRVYAFAMVLLFLHLMWTVLVIMFVNADKFSLDKLKLFVLIGVSAIVSYVLLYYYYQLLGMKNRAERVAFLTECVAKPAAPPTQQRGQTQLHNRDTKAPGTSAGTSDESGEAKAIAIHNRVQELQGKGLKCVAATAQATREYYAGQIK